MQIAQVKNNKEIKSLKLRKDILDFEQMLSATPNAKFGNNNGMTSLKHSFSEGIYAREIFIPKGAALTGKIHKNSCHIFLMKGDITIVSEEGKKRMKAPCYFVCKAGMKRIGYAHEDTIWVNIHGNSDNTTDLVKIEERETANTYLEYEKYKKQISSYKIKKLK